ncbi:hypothetical protein Hanom_Chr11g01052721 [Helianthus anomalus]
MPSEPETTNVENIEEIVFEGNEKKSSYVRQDRTEFATFDEEWLKENMEVIDEHLKNCDTSENATDVFSEWRKQFLSKVSKPVPDVAQVDFLRFENAKPTVTKIELINRSNFEGATLFERLIKMNKKSGWKDESYKPQFPIYQQIKFTLDLATNTGCYQLVY